jgi:hypothetical protein
MKSTKMTTIAAYLLWIAAAAFLVRAELRTDDAGVLVLCILVVTLLLGCLHPRRAWQWALLVGPCITAADLYSLRFETARPSLNGAVGFALLTGFVILVGLAGSYAGVIVRKVISSATGQSP